MIRFFHTADAHFGVENYGKVDQKTGIHSRFLDFVQSFERCVDRAIAEQVDFFLFCGDAYKTAYPTPTQQKQLLRLLFKLQQARIPVVIVVGNHDHPLSFGKIHSLEVFNTIPLGGIHVFSKPDKMVLETKNGQVQIVGIPWPMRHNLVSKQEHRFKDTVQIAAHMSEKVGMIIRSLASELDPEVPAMLAGHLTVSSGIFSGSEKRAVLGNDAVFLPSQLAIKPFDYVALGHLHRHQDLNKKSYPPVVYSGSIERIDFGERKDQKGFCSVCLDETKSWGKRCSYEFVELLVRPMIQIEVELEPLKNQTKQILAHIEKKNVDDAIVKIVYHIPEGEPDRVDLYAIQRACSSALSLVSIIPVRTQQVRERRVEISVTMDFDSVVNTYLEFKEDCGFDVERLRKKAQALYEMLEK